MIKTIDQDNAFSLLTRRENEESAKYLMQPEEIDSSQDASSFINMNRTEKVSEMTDSKALNKQEHLQSNKTTICSNPNDVTREKKFLKDGKEKKFVLKTNNGKFMLSKKILNLNKDKAVEKKALPEKKIKKL